MMWKWFFTGALVSVLVVDGANAAQSVKDGVYSAAQAKRGEDIAFLECTRCHSPALLGGENNTPALVGDVFQSKWKGRPLAELFEKTRTTMPSDSPGRLSASDYADVLAFLLSANKFPAGAKDLPADESALAQIVFEP